MEASKVIFSQLYIKHRDSLYTRVYNLFGGDDVLAADFFSDAILSAFYSFSDFEPGRVSFLDFVYSRVLLSVREMGMELPHPLIRGVAIDFPFSLNVVIRDKLGFDLEKVKFGESELGLPSESHLITQSEVEEQFRDPERRELLETLVSSSSKVGLPWGVLVFSFFSVLIVFGSLGYYFAYLEMFESSVVVSGIVDEEFDVSSLIDDFTVDGFLDEEGVADVVEDELVEGSVVLSPPVLYSEPPQVFFELEIPHTHIKKSLPTRFGKVFSGSRKFLTHFSYQQKDIRRVYPDNMSSFMEELGESN